MYDQILSNPTLDICLIPVAISYEFTPGNAFNSNNHLDAWKPRVSVNFGLPHFFQVISDYHVYILDNQSKIKHSDILTGIHQSKC